MLKKLLLVFVFISCNVQTESYSKDADFSSILDVVLHKEYNQDFISNPGFANSAFIYIANFNMGDFLGLYLDDECQDVIYSDNETNSTIKVFRVSNLDYGVNTFYVKRSLPGFTGSVCSPVPQYTRLRINSFSPVGRQEKINIDWSISGDLPGVIYQAKINNGDLIDDAFEGLVEITPPYSFLNVAPGTYTVYLEAMDMDGNKDTVTIDNIVVAPPVVKAVGIMEKNPGVAFNSNPGFANSAYIKVTGYDIGSRIGIYSDEDCLNSLIADQIKNSSISNISVSLNDGINKFFIKNSPPGAAIDEFSCSDPVIYTRSSIVFGNVSANYNDMIVNWDLDNIVNATYKIKLDIASSPWDGPVVSPYTFTSLSDGPYTAVVEATDQDGLVTSAASPTVMVSSLGKVITQLLKPNLTVFNSNPGYSKNGLIRITGYTVGDRIGVYSKSNCFVDSIIIPDIVTTTTLLDIPLTFNSGINKFYVKRVDQNNLLSFSCSDESNYELISSLDAPTVAVGPIDYASAIVDIPLSSVTGAVYELSYKRMGENYPGWEVATSGSNIIHGLIAGSYYNFKYRVKDQDDEYSEEQISNLYKMADMTPINCSLLSEGGEWIYVPPLTDAIGTDLLERSKQLSITYGFCIMKYEARQILGKPYSQGLNTPWIHMTQSDAKSACSSLGPGYRLITNKEWMAVALNIEAQGVNWMGGIRGSGKVYTGHSNAYIYGYNSALDASNAMENTEYYRKLYLNNGAIDDNSIIWDFSGNVSEWITWDEVTDTLGIDQITLNGHNTEWTSYISDGGKMTAFNSLPQTVLDGTVTVSSINAGLGGFERSPSVLNGYPLRGGNYWGSGGGADAGIFTLDLRATATSADNLYGFRCVYAP